MAKLITDTMQNTSHLLLVEPVNFGFNAATAVNNSFQQPVADGIQEKALAEFRHFADLLQKKRIDVTVVKDTPEPHTPDSIFPNNWISFHANGTVILYPMFAGNRRLERKENVLDAIKEKFRVSVIKDLSHYEQQDLYLEGTGSMVLDRENRIAYACLSPRTSITVLQEFCKENQYTAIHFSAVNRAGISIYHTNVLMSVADKYAVVCLDSVAIVAEKDKLVSSLQNSGKEIIPISFDQLDHFAGNMLQVMNGDGEKLLIMSSQAFKCLTKEQVERLEKYNRIIHAPLDNIEMAGGGSARCMMAEVFLPLRS